MSDEPEMVRSMNDMAQRLSRAFYGEPAPPTRREKVSRFWQAIRQPTLLTIYIAALFIGFAGLVAAVEELWGESAGKILTSLALIAWGIFMLQVYRKKEF